MKECTIFGVIIALLAVLFFGEIHSGVSEAITGITTAVERAAPHE